MEIIPIRTKAILPPQDDLLKKIKDASFELKESDCIAITSKVVSIWQGRCIPKNEADRDDLIKKEAQWYLPKSFVPGEAVTHTLKNNYLISSSGIDTNNGNGHYILWPDRPQDTASRLLEWFRKEYSISKLYLIITDSRSVLLRRGAMGCAIAWAGFEPLYYHGGEKDIFQRTVADYFTTNLPDSLAAAAVLAIGEVGEQTPLAIIRGVPYFDRENLSGDLSYELTPDEDIYAPFLKSVKWERGGAD